jgi:hypothetical protein
MLKFISVISIDEAGHGRRMAMDVSIKEQSWIGLLKKLSNLRLLVRILVKIDQDLRSSNGWSV